MAIFFNLKILIQMDNQGLSIMIVSNEVFIFKICLLRDNYAQ